MKKVICVLLTLTLLIPSFVSVNAADYSQNEKVTTVTDSRYGFTYTEYVDGNNQTIRTYKKQPTSARSSGDSVGIDRAGELSKEATKVLLSALGMEAGFINKLSDQDLQEYAECEEIYAVSSYTKTDADGNVVNVSMEEAMNAANSRGAVPTPDPGDGGYPSYDGTFVDSYMYITYVVSYRGNGQYKFSVDSQWLTMPVIRWLDSLGACSQNMTVENNTRSGWRSYTMTQVVNGNYSTYNIDENLINGTNDVNFLNAINGNWYGSAATFYLPIDIKTQYETTTFFTNYRVHYEYIGIVNYPNQQMNFNTTASYCHTTIGIAVSPSVTIATNGHSASISIAAVWNKDVRTAEFATSISYVP